MTYQYHNRVDRNARQLMTARMSEDRKGRFPATDDPPPSRPESGYEHFMLKLTRLLYKATAAQQEEGVKSGSGRQPKQRRGFRLRGEGEHAFLDPPRRLRILARSSGPAQPTWHFHNYREQERGESAGETTRRTRDETNPNSTHQSRDQTAANHSTEAEPSSDSAGRGVSER
jgi:hypothetical protein